MSPFTVGTRSAFALLSSVALVAALALLFASRSEAAWSGASEVSDATTRGASNLAADANPLGDLVLGWSYGTNDVAGVIDPAAAGPAAPQKFVGDYGAPTIGIGGSSVGAIAFQSTLGTPNYGIFAASKPGSSNSFGPVAQIQGPNDQNGTKNPILAVNGLGTGQLFHGIGNQTFGFGSQFTGRLLTNATSNTWTAGTPFSTGEPFTHNAAVGTAGDGSAVLLLKSENGLNFRTIDPVLMENDGTVSKGASIAASSGNGSGVLTNPSGVDVARMPAPGYAVVAAFQRHDGTGGGIFVADFSKARAGGGGALTPVRVSEDEDGDFPKVATDAAGNTLVTWIDPSDGGEDPAALRSVFRSAGSSTWSPSQAVAVDLVADYDMEMDELGNAYVVYQRGDVIKAATRRPGTAASWSAPETLSTDQGNVVEPTVSAGRDNEVFASWIANGTSNVYLATADVTPAVCEDGVDNDGDGKIDFPADPGCTSATDDDETDPTLPTGPGDPTSPGGGDNRVVDPDVTIAKKLTVKGTELKVSVSAGAQEDVTAKGKGSVVVQAKKSGKGGKDRRAKAKKTSLNPVTKKVEGGERTILRLKYKGGKSKRKKATKKLIKAIKQGKKATVRIQVVLTDEAGNTATEKRVSRLKVKGGKK